MEFFLSELYIKDIMDIQNIRKTHKQKFLEIVDESFLFNKAIM